MIPFRAAIPSTVKKPTSEPSEMTPPVMHAASIPPTSADGRVRNDSSARRVLPNEACSRRKTPISGGEREEQQPVLGGLPLGVLAEHLGVVAQRELDAGQGRLDVADDGAEVAARDVGVDVDAPVEALVADAVRASAPTRTVGQVAEADLAADRRVDQQVLDVGQALRGSRRRPDDDVVGLAGDEDVADLLAGEQDATRPGEHRRA